MATAVEIRNLTKTFIRGRTKLGNLRSSLRYNWRSFWQKPEKFNALEGINLTVQEGEVIGIIGPNGSGKSTLLKILSRITYPTQGRILLRGSVSSLLEVGVGFHPELTGRENIYLSGAIHGMKKKEVDEKLDSIVDFSGQEAYLNTPVKHYSSGMYMRLAFAVSAHIDPDILIMDEVLAVGDQAFRRKCIGKVRELYESGKTIFLVSHQMEHLRELCTRGIMLQHGKVVMDGSIHDIVGHYLETVESTEPADIAWRKDRTGTGVVRISRIEICDQEGRPCLSPGSGQYIILKIALSSSEAVLEHVIIRLSCFDAFGQQWFILNSRISNGPLQECPGNGVLECHIPRLPLGPGRYHFNVTLRVHHVINDMLVHAFEMQVAPGPFYKTGLVPEVFSGILVDYFFNISSGQ